MPILSLLNYNTFQKPQLVNDVANEYKSERSDYFGEHEIAKFDIIALQEQFTFSNPRPISLIEKAIEKGFNYFYKHKEPDFTSKMFINDGLLIMSKHPIVEADGTVFKPSVSRDRLMAKGVIWAKVELPNKTHVHVFNTHMLATFNHLSKDEYIMCKMRAMEQVSQLRAFVKEKIDRYFEKGDVAILCGDFNVDSLNDNFSVGKVLNHVEINKQLEEILLDEVNEIKFYEHLLEFNNNSFKISHTFFRDHQFYPVTLGNYTLDEKGNKIPMESVITAEDERLDHLNLDHIFEVHVKGKECNNKLWVRPKSSKVEEFFVKNQPFTQLSDHYGLSLEIEYIN